MIPSYMVEWHAQKKQLTRDAFAARFAHPFIIRYGDPEQLEKLSFRTQVVSSKIGLPPVNEIWQQGGMVLPVLKKPENPYPERISVGRALNCDLVIRDGTVSKLHGHFMSVGPAEAQLVDRGSANGTTLNGNPVKADPVRVVSGDSLAFGAVQVQFVEAKRLWELL
jgi:hypothetical protein